LNSGFGWSLLLTNKKQKTLLQKKISASVLFLYKKKLVE
jgi:hypothetical protein